MTGKRSAAPRPRSPERFPGRPGRPAPSFRQPSRPARPRHRSVFHWIAYEALRRAELRRARVGADAPGPAAPDPAATPGVPPPPAAAPGPPFFGLTSDEARKYIGWYIAVLMADPGKIPKTELGLRRGLLVRVWNRLLLLQGYPSPRAFTEEELQSDVETFDRLVTLVYGDRLQSIIAWTAIMNTEQPEKKRIESSIPDWKKFPVGGGTTGRGPEPTPRPPTPTPAPDDQTSPVPPPPPAPTGTSWYWWLLGAGAVGGLAYLLFAPMVREHLGRLERQGESG